MFLNICLEEGHKGCNKAIAPNFDKTRRRMFSGPGVKGLALTLKKMTMQQNPHA